MMVWPVLTLRPMARNNPNYQCPNYRLRPRARDLEDTVWQDVVNFVHEPGYVLERVRQRLMGDVVAKDGVWAEILAVERQINELREQEPTYARQNGRDACRRNL
ncbi:MAG: hypothetical protein Q8R28_05530 [Dehalococcoidia bacterium]|nr:hypothetical protein [Dehalococcoidia bacterium]